jgi:fido (protein-threonine AMPylation protein)
MVKLEIKTIKGHKYLYLRDKVKVNAKNVVISFYVGRLGKIPQDRFIYKLAGFERFKLKTYTDYRLKKHRCAFLDKKRAFDLEVLGYGYKLFKELYPDEFKRYEQAFFVRYAQGTTAIEGNTLTYRQAEELLEHSTTPAGKSMREIYELLNYKDLGRFIDSYEGDISEKIIKKIHAILMQNLLESVGAYRRIQVCIEKEEYVPPPPFEIPKLMKELIEWYRANKRKLHPLELAILLHTKVVTIHPFVDGNGRVGRALLNFVLKRNGYPTLYLGLEHREKYLDAVAEGNKENYKPIIDFTNEIYLQQHNKIYDEIIKKVQNGKVEVYPDHGRLIKEFRKITEKEG